MTKPTCWQRDQLAADTKPICRWRNQLAGNETNLPMTKPIWRTKPICWWTGETRNHETKLSATVALVWTATNRSWWRRSLTLLLLEHPKRHKEILSTCSTLDDLKSRLLEKGFDISRTALYYQLIPKRVNTRHRKLWTFSTKLQSQLNYGPSTQL